MRPTSHEVSLQGGTFSVPLNFTTFRAICAVPLDPRDVADLSLGFVDPAVVIAAAVREKRDPHTMVALRVLHAAIGSKSPGVEALATMDMQRALILSMVTLCAAITLALSPEQPTKPEGDTPKA